MSEITPLTKDQLFEKKIAENTGSDYNVGDISDVVPVTKDQSFLKEIALNSAGQSEDITELEEKVTANAEAIEAMVNVNGACNILPNNASTTTDEHGTTFTVNADKSVTVERVTPDASYSNLLLSSNILIRKGTYVLTSLINSHDAYLIINDMNDQNLVSTRDNLSVEYTFNNDTYVKFYLTVHQNTAVSPAITLKPMLYDARLNPTGYVPYAMTNAELTETIQTQEMEFNAILDTTNAYDGRYYGIIIVPGFVKDKSSFNLIRLTFFNGNVASGRVENSLCRPGTVGFSTSDTNVTIGATVFGQLTP